MAGLMLYVRLENDRESDNWVGLTCALILTHKLSESGASPKSMVVR